MYGQQSRLLVALVAFGCLLAGAFAQGSSFPYCACTRPTGPNASPYTMKLVSSTTMPDETTKVCWALTTNSNVNAGRCSMFDMRKVEIDINTQCRGAVKSITFGGSTTISPSYTAYPENNALTFKITKGTGVLGTYKALAGKTTSVCVTLNAGSCNTLPKLCLNGQCNYAFFSADNKCCTGNGYSLSPPPPSPKVNLQSPPLMSPPPPVALSAFPYCACKKAPVANSYSLSPSTSAPKPTHTVVKGKGRNTYCWTLSATRYNGTATSCTNFDLKKIELDANLGCFGAVTDISFNGMPISPSYSQYPALKGLSFKITHGTSNLATLSSLVSSPAKVCITLGGACPTLATLCRAPNCRVAFFSQNNKCCPLESLVAAA